MPAREGAARSAYWALSPAALAAELGCGTTGLSAGEAALRLRRHGPNLLAREAGSGALRLLVRQYESPLVLILVAGAAISAGLGQWTDAGIILAIVLGSTLLGFAQEHRASLAVRALRARLALKVTALRDGRPATVEARDVVPGEVVLLSAGNLVPADGLVLEARDFLVTQAALTGESFPVEKSPGLSSADAPLAGRANSVFLGTSVRSGTARVLVARTGASTELGGIAARLGEREEETGFARGIRGFGYLLTRVMTVIVLLVLAANLLLERPLVESLLFAVALAVGLTPELLPAIVSVTLSAGARRMAGQGVIVRRLEAIENLGSLDVLCTDKTGTLTRGVVELSRAVDADGQPQPRLLELAALNACLETGIENPLDAAIVAAAAAEGLSVDPARKLDEIPYDFARKRLTIVAREADGHPLLVTKGAFDAVLACSSRRRAGERAVELDEAARARLRAYYAARGAEGYRVLGLATRRVEPLAHYGREHEADLTFEGFLLFLDPLKDGIADTLAALAANGIAVKIVTGDNRHVASHVAAAVGLDTGRVLTGQELAETREEALWHLAEEVDLFAEVDPQQKERIVRALQRRGHCVAYLGDGINDAPALHTADVGVSVDQAVDVARESADIVLLRSDLGVLLDGVVQGRRTFANTLKYVAITTSANFGNMISMAIATLFVPFLPLLAKQILLNNLLSDIPSMAIATDNVDPGVTARVQRWQLGRIRTFMVVFGLVSTVFDLVTFAVLLRIFQADAALFQTTWFVVSLLTELAVVLVLRTRLPAWRSRPSRLLAVATAGVAGVALALPYLGPLAGLLGFVPLPAHLLLAALAIVALYIATTELAKRRLLGP